jgi:glycine/sarcosine/betaine reductase complex component A
VLIGTPNPESSELVATTLTEGDPTWAGVLAGVRLELPVFHITEEPIKAVVPPEVYAAQVGLADVALDTLAIADTVQRVRARLPAHG